LGSPTFGVAAHRWPMAASEKDGDEKSAPMERSWTGVSSVWEFQATTVRSSVEEAGGRDPVASEMPKYLNEAILGMRGGPGDSKQKETTAVEARSPSARSATSVDMRVQVLREMIEKQSCVTTGTNLFWLVLSGIFHCIEEQVRDSSRTSLGQSWQSFRLEIAQSLKHDQITKNWVIATLPYLYAQTIFRLFFDGFPDDRHAVISNDHNFMNNIVMVIHFELMGFQINLDTAKKLRRGLFLPRVLQRPHVNQDEYLRGQRRQAELENQLLGLGTRPLKFGHLDAPRPDEIQLEHVLQGRAELLSGKTSAWMSQSAAMYANKNREKELVPPDLSVDRYLQLSNQGLIMLDRHMGEMDHIMTGAEPEADELQQFGGLDLDLDLIDEGGADHIADGLTSNCASPLARGNSGLALTMDDDDDFGDDGSPLSPSSRLLSPDSPDADDLLSPAGKRAARVRRARMAGHLSNMQKKATERREEEAKMKRQRQELLEQKLKAEQLPDELTRTELNTTWVSPGMKSLYVDAKDRDVMHKTRCESFGLKMSQSSPLITSPSSPLMKSSRSSRSVNFGETGASKEEGDRDRGISKRGSTFARIGVETLILEPPANLSAKVVYGRLDAASKASQTLSFANYTKEYDVFTGDLKQRFDAERLRSEETSYLKKMKGLVGERGDKTKKLLYPGGELNRRSQSSGSRRLG